MTLTFRNIANKKCQIVKMLLYVSSFKNRYSAQNLLFMITIGNCTVTPSSIVKAQTLVKLNPFFVNSAAFYIYYFKSF